MAETFLSWVPLFHFSTNTQQVMTDTETPLNNLRFYTKVETESETHVCKHENLDTRTCTLGAQA